MTIVGSSFTKISIERTKPYQGKININNNISIIDIVPEELSLGKSDESGLKFIFEYTCTYEPGVGSISLTGELMAIDKEDVAKKIIDSWAKTKQIPKEFMTQILNVVL